VSESDECFTFTLTLLLLFAPQKSTQPSMVADLQHKVSSQHLCVYGAHVHFLPV
jgi:hypothetical protein